MRYKIGDTVTIISLKREGTIIEVLSGGSYRVTLGSLPIVAKEGDLSPAKKSPTSKKSQESKITVQSSAQQGKEKEELDLHGQTVAEAISLLEEKINRAILAKLHRIKIVHGIGSGRVKDGVLNYLAESSLISAYKSDEFNPGVTWVYL